MCKEPYGYVYMVRNKINGKIYFGITIYDFYIRYKGSIAKHTHNEHLQNSINTYGIENFEIIEQFDVAYNEDDLWDLEDMYICLYNTLDNRYGYNKQRSGSKHKGHGKHSEESKRKNSESQTERWANKSEEEKKQFSEMRSEVQKQRMANKSEEEKKQFTEKMREAKTEMWANMSEEEKKQWSEKMREAKTEMWANMSEEKKKQWSEMRSEVQTKVWANMSEEKKKQRSEKIKQTWANMSEEEKKQRSEAVKGDKNPSATKVICLETEQVFTTIKEAQEWFGCSNQIGQCCEGKRKSCGKHPITGERLHWMYYKDYLEQQNKEKSDTNNN